MEVRLISSPSMPAEDLCGMAAAQCYEGKHFKRSLSVAMDVGHHSVLEHAAFTFKVEGVSRVLLAQLTRHRIASYSVKRQRYCGVQAEWIVPETIKEAGLTARYIEMCNECFGAYCHFLAHDIPEEDARYVIPQGAACDLIITMNARELRHFFSMRCCKRAQKEIRDLALRMLELCQIAAPQIFADAGAGCVRGACPEGKKCCGKPWERVDG